MSLFQKTVVVRGSLSHADANEIGKAFKILAEHARDRFEENEARIADLESEVARLKRAPRASLRAKLLIRGLP